MGVIFTGLPCVGKICARRERVFCARTDRGAAANIANTTTTNRQVSEKLLRRPSGVNAHSRSRRLMLSAKLRPTKHSRERNPRPAGLVRTTGVVQSLINKNHCGPRRSSSTRKSRVGLGSRRSDRSLAKTRRSGEIVQAKKESSEGPPGYISHTIATAFSLDNPGAAPLAALGTSSVVPEGKSRGRAATRRASGKNSRQPAFVL